MIRLVQLLSERMISWLFLTLLTVGVMAQAGEFNKLTGHGGPVKAIDVSPSGDAVLTASFDYSVGLWKSGKPVWLEGHNAAVNSVRFIDRNRAASAGDDFDVLIWNLETHQSRRLEGHKGKIISLAVSPDRRLLASASWDGTIGIWDLTGNTPPHFLKGHTANVNAVAFAGGGSELYSASADGTIRLWNVQSKQLKHVVLRHGFGINTLVVNELAGWLVYGTVDGGTRFIEIGTGRVIADMTLDRRPILAMDLSADLTRLAVGDGHGYIMIINVDNLSLEFDFRAAKQGPIWALKYSADGENIFAGGFNDAVFSWPVGTSPDAVQLAAEEPGYLKSPQTVGNGERQFRRSCSICHSLEAEGDRRAGPSLHGIFGRRAGTFSGYAYSPAMRKSNIVWSVDSIGALFDLGPDHYVPGTKMPMQRITRQQDRDALIAFLQGATAP